MPKYSEIKMFCINIKRGTETVDNLGFSFDKKTKKEKYRIILLLGIALEKSLI